MSGREKMAAGVYLAGFVAVLGYMVKMALRVTRLHPTIDELEKMFASPSSVNDRSRGQARERVRERCQPRARQSSSRDEHLASRRAARLPLGRFPQG
jgi:hypothetical protein